MKNKCPQCDAQTSPEIIDASNGTNFNKVYRCPHCQATFSYKAWNTLYIPMKVKDANHSVIFEGFGSDVALGIVSNNEKYKWASF